MNSRLFFGLCLAAAAILLLVYLFRYQAMPSPVLGEITLFDRWTQRVCVVSLRTSNKIACSLEELQSSAR